MTYLSPPAAFRHSGHFEAEIKLDKYLSDGLTNLSDGVYNMGMSKPKPPSAAEIARVMSALGKRTSAAKKAASRENGKKGGRPKGRGK